MKKAFAFLIAVQTTIFSIAQTQIQDDFFDGNFTDTPAWSGDTANFIINTSQQLQLSAQAAASQSYLTTPSEIINQAEWSFYVKLEFNPSSSNFMDIYLVSDMENLKDPLNGYFVRIGNTQDEISLYKQSGAKSTAQKIIDGPDKRIDLNAVELRIKVTKSQENIWELLVDYDLSGTFDSEGTVMDNEHFFSQYFGLVCTYTSTRSDKFFFDDLMISGNSFHDDIKPTIDTLWVKSDSSIQIAFSEKVKESTAKVLNNYSVDKSIGNPKAVIFENDSLATLLFINKFLNKVEYQISVGGIEDIFGNVTDETDISFTYVAPYLLEFNDILITEIMADPSPGVDLPEFEYLEIFNPGSEIYNVSQMDLVVGKDKTTLPDFSIAPGEYIILCQSSAVDHFTNYGRTMKVSNWPTLNNSGEDVTLYNKEKRPVFSIDYKDSWYGSVEKDDGGWSLEMIDTDFPCKGSENWASSDDPLGGTPGRKNSFLDQLTDMAGPQITKILAMSDDSATVYLNEKISPAEISTGQVLINPFLEIESIRLSSPDFTKISIKFSNTILPKTSYVLTLKNLRDCPGNIQKETSLGFVLPEAADSLDLIINEILFNPPPDGNDFVEIYNQSDKYIDLISVRIGNGEDIKPITGDHFIIEPKQFLVLCESAANLKNHYPGIEAKNILESADLPAFNDDEGEVFLLSDNGKLIDFVRYSDDYHSEFLRDTEGVSLERISFGGYSDNPDNWHSASATSGFATPGKMNSQFMADNVSGEEVIVDPAVFAPGSSGYPEFTTIKCNFGKTGNMAGIKILDSQGRVIKTIISNRSIGREESFKWEGTDDAGQQVRMGPYIVFLEIYNMDGTKKLIRKKVVVAGRM